MLSAVILPNIAAGDATGVTTGTPEVRPLWSSRTREQILSNFQRPSVDRDRTVSRRSKPSSRTSLNGEQPYPWDLLQPQDEMSRHRGAKHRRRYELLGGIGLLSPGTFYPLSDGPSIPRTTGSQTYFRTCSTWFSQLSAFAFILYAWFPTTLSAPSYSSVTLWRRPPQPNYLTRHGPPSRITGQS